MRWVVRPACQTLHERPGAERRGTEGPTRGAPPSHRSELEPEGYAQLEQLIESRRHDVAHDVAQERGERRLECVVDVGRNGRWNGHRPTLLAAFRDRARSSAFSACVLRQLEHTARRRY